MPPQLGWRLKTADKDLYFPLFKTAYQQGMHKIPHGKVGDRWKDFVTFLFKNTEGFMGHEVPSVKCIREQYDARIASFKKLVGWEDGRCGNLSGKMAATLESWSKLLSTFFKKNTKTSKLEKPKKEKKKRFLNYVLSRYIYHSSSFFVD